MDYSKRDRVILRSKTQLYSLLQLVDGPRGNGYTEDQTGRMSRIFMASRLCTPGGYVFVHDTERPVESAYSARYLGEENLVNKIRGRSLLKQYLAVSN